jgi:hypothetical protein
MTPHHSIVRKLCMVVLTLGLCGCALFGSKEARYLCGAKGKATQAEVRERLGPPVSMSTTATDSIWVYQIRQLQSGSRVNAAGLWCEEYVLHFDSQTVLKEWTRKAHFHGGETQPTFCVPGSRAVPTSG